MTETTLVQAINDMAGYLMFGAFISGVAGAMAYHIVIGACSAVLEALSRRRVRKAMADFNERRYG